VGLQTVGYRGRSHLPTGYEERLALGVSHLASLALANARLVDELEEANRFKADFLANMSHELRTPLNVVIGYNEMLMDGAFGPLNAEQRDTLARVSETARGQLGLITATLQLSRFEARDVPVEQLEIDLHRLLEDLKRESEVLPERRRLTFGWRISPDLPVIRTDVVKLKMVLKNLIDNAAKYTEQGSVQISAERVGQDIRFEVADTGPGIAPEALEHIFAAFHQTVVSNRGGVGLGLYIVHRLVEALGGVVEVTSTLGVGSSFVVTLPFEEIPAAAIAVGDR
jgi:signal transduction histidine kinase